MIVHDRHEAILGVLRKWPRLELPRLQHELGISRSTLRRDLLELEHLGEVVRVRGGVVHADFVKGEPSFDRRRAVRVDQKKAMARRAVKLVPENATVYIDAGSTCLELGRLLVHRADLRIFTHSIRLLADACTLDSAASLVCVGGEYRAVSDAVVGGLTAAWMKQMSFDMCFVAASGVDATGCSTTELTETLVKQSILERSAHAVLLADSDKWNKPSTVRFTDWSGIAQWVCDDDLAPSVIRQLKSRGTQVVTAT